MEKLLNELYLPAYAMSEMKGLSRRKIKNKKNEKSWVGVERFEEVPPFYVFNALDFLHLNRRLSQTLTDG